jgi:hypothetical protein
VFAQRWAKFVSDGCPRFPGPRQVLEKRNSNELPPVLIRGLERQIEEVENLAQLRVDADIEEPTHDPSGDVAHQDMRQQPVVVVEVFLQSWNEDRKTVEQSADQGYLRSSYSSP